MEKDELDDLRKDFIVDHKEYDEVNTKEMLKKVTKHAKVSKEGKVFLLSKDAIAEKRLKMILVARFLANKLHAEISPQVSVEELAEYASLEKKQTAARMAEIVKDNFAKRDSKGVFSVMPFQIERFLSGYDAQEAKQ